MAKTSLAGALIFFVLVTAGVVWGLDRMGMLPRRETAGGAKPILQVSPAAAQTAHRFSFTLGEPSRLTLALRNDGQATGMLRVGAPTVAKQSAFDVPGADARAFEIDGSPTQSFVWLDLAVGTRVVEITLERESAIGLSVHVAPARE